MNISVSKLYEEKYYKRVLEPKPTIKTFLMTLDEAKVICEKHICVGPFKGIDYER